MLGSADERPRINADAIIADLPEMQPTGERYCELALASSEVALTPPYGRMQVVAFLKTLLNREPMKSSPAYLYHRNLLGSFLIDLEGYAVRDAAADPDGLAPPDVMDLRDPAIIARERRFVADWAQGRQVESRDEYGRYIDRDILDRADDHGAAITRLEAAVDHAGAWTRGEVTATPIEEAPAAPVPAAVPPSRPAVTQPAAFLPTDDIPVLG